MWKSRVSRGIGELLDVGLPGVADPTIADRHFAIVHGHLPEYVKPLGDLFRGANCRRCVAGPRRDIPCKLEQNVLVCRTVLEFR
jgi:hypothetical protein